ncbi:tRNA (N6-threonylcarbamoyladenosine(37)-N6)-methyltransferase TrmO [Oscillibacter sp.]|uniref:tRNA (N6-threonylcarbamoyladenosine(37)-N6)-methyltransferase TrmO n=1 Tax=Oscillibacter sp. TaxID=1945593 RepID=UPI002DBE884A|nr:tRNA (N6-threonylcarbamoyladenosine(37)-N6)-methyltransferase TrmO [Oscillibacter sp.]
MHQEFTMRPIARIHSDFSTKFGVPRQSGLVDSLEATVVFESEFRNPDALRGLEGFSHIWLVWVFDQAVRKHWSPTVRPPRLGGNTRMGVFATRSPFRPNPIALSCVKLAGIEETVDHGTVLRILGADLMDGTPILDIKPYIPYADSHPEALGGFASVPAGETLEVIIPPELLERVPENRQEALRGVLAQDPRPHYQEDPERVYGFGFAGMEVKFSVEGKRLTVRDISAGG